MVLYALTAVENTSFSFDKLFTYAVPKGMKLLPGVRVTVPFGGGNKTRVAMVMEVSKTYDGGNTKQVASVLDAEPLLNDEMLALVKWMKERYFCTYFDAVKLMLPGGIGYRLSIGYRISSEKPLEKEAFSDIEWQIMSFLMKSSAAVPAEKLVNQLGISDISPIDTLVKRGLVIREDMAKRRIGDASTKMVRVVPGYQGRFTPKQRDVWNVLMDVSEVSVKELMYFTGASANIVKALVQNGAAEFFEEEVYRRPRFLTAVLEEEKTVRLSIEQEKVFDQLVDEYESGSGISLLYGVTGSGKTSVFLKLIDYVIGTGREVILMVPEISLTPQTIELFRAKFGDDIAVFHSGLSIGERLDEWKRAAKGEAKIVIGTRSAVFAPLRNLGLIVIDEEQEHTYKSESSPRYHAREVAKFRTGYCKAFCLLSSATPSLESYYMVSRGKYGFNSLNLRFGDASIPDVRLVDMNNEVLFGNTTDVSFPLKKALNENLAAGKQSIVLLNRRGYHTFARCTSCHEVMTCPNCSISLTYHTANNRLMCHYCGYSKKFSSECPECGHDTVTYSGFGTQRAEETLAESVPGARILRIDADTTAGKYSLEKKLDAFAKGDYDIMVGTQMVAKGLNFENVTLVGVISADQSLYSDDYRSNERTFDLLTQVVGRAGRGKYPGKAIIQTGIPENPYLRLAANQDYFSFYEMEIMYRQAMLYPPFVDLVVVGFTGEKETAVREGAEYFLRMFSDTAKKEYAELPLRVLRPAPAAVARISNRYRYKLIIKCKNTGLFRELLTRNMMDFAKKKEYSSVTVFADPNPDTIL